MATYTPADDYQSRVVVEMARFRDWAGPGVELYIGELGCPNNKAGDQSLWNDMFEILLARASKDNISLTIWATGLFWGSDYRLGIYYKNGSTWETRDTTDTWEAGAYHRSGLFGGVNFAGPEFAPDDDYIGNPVMWPLAAYPFSADLRFLRSRGAQVIRQPFRWERMASALSGPLRGAEVTAMYRALNAAQAHNMKVILDIHNYAILDASAEAAISLGDATVRAGWLDLCKRILEEFGWHPAFYALDIMNEPHEVQPHDWEEYSQELVTFLRDEGLNHKLFVPLGSFSGVQDLTFNHLGGPWITDPANNFVYEGHYYPEAGHSGNFANTYAQEVTLASSFAGQGEFDWDGETSGSFGPEARVQVGEHTKFPGHFRTQ